MKAVPLKLQSQRDGAWFRKQTNDLLSVKPKVEKCPAPAFPQRRGF